MTPGGASQPVVAGLVTALVGFAGAFTVVLAGLRGAGADPAQAASGLLALCVTMGACAIVLGLWLRMPVAIAWSTPGAALLVSTGPPHGGWPAAVGAFVVCGVLLVLTGFWRPLGRALAAIPAPLAAAMLAGVLLPLCLAPARAVVELPWQGLPVVLVWAVLALTARRWAVPGALLVEAVAGLALLGALGSSLATATASAAHRDAGVACRAISASGITALGISAPFWGLAAGLVLWAVGRRLAARAGTSGPPPAPQGLATPLVAPAMTSEGGARRPAAR